MLYGMQNRIDHDAPRPRVNRDVLVRDLRGIVAVGDRFALRQGASSSGGIAEAGRRVRGRGGRWRADSQP